MTHSATTWVSPQWLQQGLDALREALDVSGPTKREMIQFLFDSGLWDQSRLSWEAAVSRFNACLNPSKPEFFKPVEVWALSKEFDRPQFFLAMGRDLGFEVRRIPSSERQEALLQQAMEAFESAQRTFAELARLQAPHGQRIEAAIGAGTGRFSNPDAGIPGGF